MWRPQPPLSLKDRNVDASPLLTHRLQIHPSISVRKRVNVSIDATSPHGVRTRNRPRGGTDAVSSANWTILATLRLRSTTLDRPVFVASVG